MNQATNTPTAYSYIRFSTPEQMGGDSFRRQVERSRKYADEHGLFLDESLRFQDLGVSAYDKSNLGEGRQLRAFIDAIDCGVVLPGSYLLVESLDRITRADVMDALEIFTSILNRGIILVTLTDKMVYSREKANKNFTDLMVSIAVLARANEESATKSDRLKNAWENKRRNLGTKKLTSICPAWLRLSEDGAAYIEIPEKVAVVREIYRLIMSGMGKNAIAKKFNEQGIPSIGNLRKKRNPDQTWFASYIVKITRSRALIGEFQPHEVVKGKRQPVGEPISDYFPKILTNEEFALLQHLVSERGQRSGGNRGKTFSNLLTGLLKCGYCGASMVYVNKGTDKRGNRNQKLNQFLVCSGAKRGLGCYHVPWTYDDFEKSFLENARQVDFKAFVTDAPDAGALRKKIADLLIIERAKKKDLVTKRDRLIDVLQESNAKPASVLEKIAAFESEIDDVSAQLEELEQHLKAENGRVLYTADALKALSEVIDQMESLEGDELYMLRARINETIRRVVNGVQVCAGGKIYTPEAIENFKTELADTGRYAASELDEYVKFAYSTAPNRQERYFLIRNRMGATQVIFPEKRIPDWDYAIRHTPELVRAFFHKDAEKDSARTVNHRADTEPSS